MSAQHTPGISSSVISLRPFIKDKNFSLDEVLRMIQNVVNLETENAQQANARLFNEVERLEKEIASAPLLKEQNEKMAKAIKLVCDCLKDGIPIENGDPIHETLKREFPNLLNP